ncbi:DUF6019 family protein [Desulfosporosinus sp. OT]|uniref:DUF6019 family protein n=1 Tax=Desulfosporosinus sp. OT TaxID=913865 RepID=UPI0002239BCE|nr:DUF6019 family protein [Desulfosporosinus sp. OT]EGW37349.1 hypothetical protein DOT_4794 [Desulfosporosinus sp. OT]
MLNVKIISNEAKAPSNNAEGLNYRKDDPMHDTTNYVLLIAIVILPILSAISLYYIIKMAVRNGVQEANARMLESVRALEDSTYEIKKGLNKKEST